MNYTQLVTAVSDYTQNTFSTTDINTFIEQAEARIYNTIQFPSLRKNVVGTLTATTPYLLCPADYLSTYSVAVIDSSGNYNYLLNKDVSYIREAYPNPSSNGLPQCYAIFGPQYNNATVLSFLLGPTPDQNYSVEMHYFFYPPSIIMGQITALNTFVAGSGYTSGTYYNAALTGGTGSGATAIITVVGGIITSMTLQSPGSGYAVGDVLGYTDPNNVGSGFSTAVLTVNNASV